MSACPRRSDLTFREEKRVNSIQNTTDRSVTARFCDWDFTEPLQSDDTSNLWAARRSVLAPPDHTKIVQNHMMTMVYIPQNNAFTGIDRFRLFITNNLLHLCNIRSDYE